MSRKHQIKSWIFSMTEDEACELLVTQRAYWMYGVGWRIILERMPYGDNIRLASPEESLVLEKVMATVSGPKDTDQVVATDTTGYEGLFTGY
jgi:hypothetical protein